MEKKKDNNLDLGNLITLDENRVKEIFDHDYQNKFIKVFLNDIDFFSSVFDIVVPQYFDDYQRLLIDKVINFYKKNSTTPDYEDLKRQIRIDEKNELKKDHLIGLIEKIKDDTTVKSDKIIKETAYTYFKKRAVADALYKMASMWGKDDFDGMTQPLMEALKAGENKRGGLDYIKELEKTLVEDLRRPIKIMSGIDEEIEGGVSGGELVIILAPTGGGKSMVLVQMAANSLINSCANVLYISLELSERYIGRRFNSCFTGIKLKELNNYPDAIREKVEDIFNDKCGRLKIKSFPTRRATISKIRSYIDSLEREEGFRPDILFLDYASILDSSGYDKEHRIAQQLLYQDLRGYGGETNIPIVSADQCNRNSLKLKYLTIESVAESYAKLSEVDLILGIGRGETGDNDENGKPITLRDLNEATIGFLKNRMGADGFYKHMSFDTSTVQIKVINEEKKNVMPSKGFNNGGSNGGKNSTYKPIVIKEKDAQESIISILERENNK